MDPKDFVYWLRGFMEICNPKTINEQQTKVIKEHLEKCFTEVVPVGMIPLIDKLPEPGIGGPGQPDWIRKYFDGEKPYERSYCQTNMGVFNPNLPMEGSC